VLEVGAPVVVEPVSEAVLLELVLSDAALFETVLSEVVLSERLVTVSVVLLSVPVSLTLDPVLDSVVLEALLALEPEEDVFDVRLSVSLAVDPVVVVSLTLVKE